MADTRNAYRLELELSSLTYRGDRDERLTEWKISGEGETEQDAFIGLLEKLHALGSAGYVVRATDLVTPA